MTSSKYTKGIGFIATNIQVCDKCAVISCKSSESDSLSEINVTTKKVIRSYVTPLHCFWCYIKLRIRVAATSPIHQVDLSGNLYYNYYNYLCWTPALEVSGMNCHVLTQPISRPWSISILSVKLYHLTVDILYIF